jgi:hypothetical protein
MDLPTVSKNAHTDCLEFETLGDNATNSLGNELFDMGASSAHVMIGPAFESLKDAGDAT